MRDPLPLRTLLAELEHPASTQPRLRGRSCPGASVCVTLEEYRSYEREGVRWETYPATGEPSTRVYARAHCTELVEVRQGIGHGPVMFALCQTCQDLESRHRSGLQSRRENP